MQFLRTMYQLPLHGNVLVFDHLALNRYVVCVLLGDYLRHVCTEVLHCVVISDRNLTRNKIYTNKIFILYNFPFSGHNFIPNLINIINNFLLNRHILDPTISLNKIRFYTLLLVVLGLGLRGRGGGG